MMDLGPVMYEQSKYIESLAKRIAELEDHKAMLNTCIEGLKGRIAELEAELEERDKIARAAGLFKENARLRECLKRLYDSLKYRREPDLLAIIRNELGLKEEE